MGETHQLHHCTQNAPRKGTLMTNYRRHYRAGGIYFFTLVLADRRQGWLVSHIAVSYTHLTLPTTPYV